MHPTQTRAVNVLLIEDDPYAAALFLERTRRFAPGEFGITQARSLESGLGEVSHSRFDLAVLDLTLPDSSGIETCTRFCEVAPDVPFVVLTGVVDSSLLETLSRAGAKAVIVKDDCAGQDMVNAMRTAHRVSEKARSMLPAAFTSAANARVRNAIIDNADGIVVLDEAGTVSLVSAGAESLLGRTAAELQGSALGVELRLGQPIRVQLVREQPGQTEVYDDRGMARQFDVCKLNINEVEFWAFAHQWSGKPVTVCAIRDVTNQVSEENRQRSIATFEQQVRLSAGLDEVGSDLAVRMSALLRFNRFETAVWRPELNRLQIVFELGMSAAGR
ncbi:MAG: response regulator, partial [Chloroflexi bacterium]|nr:response regulator [Chloroflexota bacterium]